MCNGPWSCVLTMNSLRTVDVHTNRRQLKKLNTEVYHALNYLIHCFQTYNQSTESYIMQFSAEETKIIEDNFSERTSIFDVG